MRSFSAGFTAEKNKKTGATPVWMLQCTLGDATVYLSDIPVTVPWWPNEFLSTVTKPWIASWGRINMGIGAGLDDAQVSDFSVSCIIDRADQNNIENLLGSCVPEKHLCALWLWYNGLDALSAPPQVIWTGYITDYEFESETIIKISMEDASIRCRNYVGTKITRADYPDADPDDVGRVKPIVYGSVKRLACPALKAGAMTLLQSNMDVGQDWLRLGDPGQFRAGMEIVVDAEHMLITVMEGYGSTYCEVTRGYNDTLAAEHAKGATVWEFLTQYIYLVADHPVKSIDRVWVRVNGLDVDITSLGSLVSRYTGQAGSQLGGWGARAVVALSGYLTVEQAMNIGIIDAEWTADYMSIRAAISISQGNHGHGLSTASAVNDQAASLPPKVNVPTNPQFPWAVGNITFPANSSLTTANFEIHYDYDVYFLPNTSFPCSLTVTIGGVVLPSYNPTGNTITVTAPANDPVEVAIHLEGASPQAAWGGITITSAKRTGYLSATEQAPASGVTHNYDNNMQGDVYMASPSVITGNSSANTIVGDEVLADVQGHMDTPSGTYTGTPGALIERPDHVIKHFTSVYAGSAAGMGDAGPEMAASGYKFAGAIREYKTAWQWLQDMARQCRCRLKMRIDRPHLTWCHETAPASQRTITADMVRMNSGGRLAWRRYRTRLSDLINTVNLHYDRDWSTYDSGDTACKGVISFTDASSVADHGASERPDLFRFEFVADFNMAGNNALFYRSRYKGRHWVHEFTVFLDNCDLEAGDTVTLAFAPGSPVCEVISLGFQPGGRRQNDTIIIVAMEY